MSGFKRIRAAAAVCCWGLGLGLLVAGTVPITSSMPPLPQKNQKPIELTVWQCTLVVSWDAPGIPPPRGTWAGQTNHFGVRYNRYTNGSGNVGLPIWLFALPFIAAGVIIAPRSRRRIPLTRLTLSALLPAMLILLWVRSHTPNPGFHVFGEWFLDFQSGVAMVERLQLTAVGSRTAYGLRPVGQVPLWPLLMVSVFPLAVVLWRYRQRFELIDTACSECGYDLRATPLRCPECGTEVPSGSPFAVAYRRRHRSRRLRALHARRWA